MNVDLCWKKLHEWIPGQKKCMECRRIREGKTKRISKIRINRDHMRTAGICECCGDIVKRRVVDHCHTTGRIRGSLCHHCNVMLGFAKDSPERLMLGAKYLQK